MLGSYLLLTLILLTVKEAPLVHAQQPTPPASPIVLPMQTKNPGECPSSVMSSGQDQCTLLQKAVQQVNRSIALTSSFQWSVSGNCLEHNTVCTIKSDRNDDANQLGTQIEDVGYLFSKVCEKRVEVSVHYHYHVGIQRTQYNSNLHIQTGDTYMTEMLKVRNGAGVEVGVQYIAADVYKKDSKGKIMHIPGLSDVSRVEKLRSSWLTSKADSGKADPAGTWVMLHVMYKQNGVVVDWVTYELHVSKQDIISVCPTPSEASTETEKEGSRGILWAAVVLGSAVFMLTVSLCAVKWFYARKTKALEARQIHVVPAHEMRVVSADAFVPGQRNVVVQGTVLVGGFPQPSSVPSRGAAPPTGQAAQPSAPSSAVANVPSAAEGCSP